MLTAEQIYQSRAAAVAAVRRQLGLSDLPSNWTLEQRALYVKTLAAYVAARPDQFTAQDLRTAAIAANADYGQLEDASFDWGMFITESFRPAGDALQSVGNGVLTVANAAKWAIPAAAIAGGVLLFLWANKRLGSPLKIPGTK